MLFHAKSDELQRQLAYVQRELERRCDSSYPNLEKRLRIQLNELAELETSVVAINRRLLRYEASAAQPAFDTWRQIFKDISDLSFSMQWLRTIELPAYLAATSDDHFIANILEQTFREIGLPDVYPVASLHQAHWFSVHPAPPQYPLFFVPALLTTDPGELALIYHEIGHVLYSLWAPEFGGHIENALETALKRKVIDVHNQADPEVRKDLAHVLADWQHQAYSEIEEMVCDIVGALLGGPPFVLALTLGLVASSKSPFDHDKVSYPPLDTRIRLGSLVLRRRNLTDDPALLHVEEGWSQVQPLYIPSQPRWYTWLYDEQYLTDIVAAVEFFLINQGLQLYENGCGGLRGLLRIGAAARLHPELSYQDWAQDMVATLRRDCDPGSPESSSS